MREPEAIREEVIRTASELKAKRHHLQGLLRELQDQLPERIPIEPLHQEKAPPLAYHYADLLESADAEFEDVVRVLEEFIDLDEGEVERLWREQRRLEFTALLKSTIRDISTVDINHLATNGRLPDDQLGVAARGLEAIRKNVNGA